MTPEQRKLAIQACKGPAQLRLVKELLEGPAPVHIEYFGRFAGRSYGEARVGAKSFNALHTRLVQKGFRIKGRSLFGLDHSKAIELTWDGKPLPRPVQL